MRAEFKLMPYWLGLVLLVLLGQIPPHQSVEPMALVNVAIQVLLGVIAVAIARRSSPEQRPVFVNLAIFFFSVLILLSTSYVGTLFFKNDWSAIIRSYVYINRILLTALLFHTLAYTVIDYMFDRRSRWAKYATSIGATLLVTFLVFQPYIGNPLALYDAHAYRAHGELDALSAKLAPAADDGLRAAALKKALNLHDGRDEAVVLNGVAVTPADVDQLTPYLHQGGAGSIFWQPISVRIIAVDLLLIVILVGFLFSLYRSARPYHSYIDKLLIVFLVLCLLDVLHTLGNMYATTIGNYLSIFSIGHLITIMVSLMLVYVMDMKFRFVLTASGKYYEETLLTTPWNVTRFRDEIDVLLLRTFLRKDTFKGRFFVAESTHESGASTPQI